MPEHYYRPAEGHRLPHDPFNAIVAPRPIGWIGTVSRAGVQNLAPYSFFTALAYTPPLVGFSSMGYKDSARNAEETGEFTWNLVTRPLAGAMNASSTQTPVDEFVAAGLTVGSSIEIEAPQVADSPVTFECRTADVIILRGAAGAPVGSWLVIGEVVGVHIDTELLVDGIYQTARARPVTRAGGPTAYFEITEDTRFDLRRPD